MIGTSQAVIIFLYLRCGIYLVSSHDQNIPSLNLFVTYNQMLLCQEMCHRIGCIKTISQIGNEIDPDFIFFRHIVWLQPWIKGCLHFSSVSKVSKNSRDDGLRSCKSELLWIIPIHHLLSFKLHVLYTLIALKIFFSNFPVCLHRVDS